MWGLVAGVLLAAGMVWLVLDPILRPRVLGDAAEPVDPDDDMSPRAVALRALSEIEFDRATGKLSPTDYEDLKARYTREAVDALREGGGTPDAGGAAPVAPPRAATAATPSAPAATAPPAASRRPNPAPASTPACPVHGPQAVGATFCPECGRRLGLRSGERCCTRCGFVLETDARFCGRCGGRVAA